VFESMAGSLERRKYRDGRAVDGRVGITQVKV
jgi:hypothetical protein